MITQRAVGFIVPFLQVMFVFMRYDNCADERLDILHKKKTARAKFRHAKYVN